MPDMSALSRLDAYQRRHRWLGMPIGVLYKYLDDQGAYLSALITYYGFLALFPLLLLLSSILGFVVEDNPALRQQILDSALRQIPVIGDQIQSQTLTGSTVAVSLGLLGALYGAMGVAQAIQNAMNVAWNIPRNRRPNPFLLRAKSLLLLLVLGVFLLLTTALSQLGPTLGAMGFYPHRTVGFIAIAGAFLISVAMFYGYSRIGVAAYVGNRTLLPGAVLAALCWQGLQTVGSTIVGIVGSQNSTYGTFGVVLGLIAWLYLAAISLVLSTELNVVLARRLYPRSLLTPMTDDVDLTSADQRAYAGMVRAQRLKGFQRVTVSFDHKGQNASAKRARAEDSEGSE